METIPVEVESVTLTIVWRVPHGRVIALSCTPIPASLVLTTSAAISVR